MPPVQGANQPGRLDPQALRALAQRAAAQGAGKNELESAYKDGEFEPKALAIKVTESLGTIARTKETVGSIYVPLDPKEHGETIKEYKDLADGLNTFINGPHGMKTLIDSLDKNSAKKREFNISAQNISTLRSYLKILTAVQKVYVELGKGGKSIDQAFESAGAKSIVDDCFAIFKTAEPTNKQEVAGILKALEGISAHSVGKHLATTTNRTQFIALQKFLKDPEVQSITPALAA